MASACATMLPDVEQLAASLVGMSAGRPVGQLSGHAAGSAMERLVGRALDRRFPDRTFRQADAMNQAMAAHPGQAFGAPALNYLMTANRSRAAMQGWSPGNQFHEKQDDTADFVVFSDAGKLFESAFVCLIDVKAENVAGSGFPGNKISANKLVELARILLSSDSQLEFEIVYLFLRYQDDVETLGVAESNVVSLTKIPPERTSINFTAGRQLQFPSTVAQSFRGTGREWLQAFLWHFCGRLESRVAEQQGELDRLRSLLSASTEFDSEAAPSS